LSELRCAAALPHAARDVELEDVHQLMSDHVIVVRVDAGQRQHDTIERGLREAAGAFTDQPRCHGSLLKVRVVLIDDQRLLLVEFVLEEPGKTHVPALREIGDVLRVRRARRVVVNQEMLGLENFEFEPLPQHLISAEVLRMRHHRP
jgi:hypothetical protein